MFKSASSRTSGILPGHEFAVTQTELISYLFSHLYFLPCCPRARHHILLCCPSQDPRIILGSCLSLKLISVTLSRHYSRSTFSSPSNPLLPLESLHQPPHSATCPQFLLHTVLARITFLQCQPGSVPLLSLPPAPLPSAPPCLPTTAFRTQSGLSWAPHALVPSQPPPHSSYTECIVVLEQTTLSLALALCTACPHCLE